MRVQHLNATPSLDHDVMRVTDRVGGRLMPVGFYYKTFIRPRRLWPVYEKVLRNAAGLGRVPRDQDARRWRTDYRRRHADVLVVGAGPAGLSAAIGAAALGADVVLVDEQPEPGGHLLHVGREDRARELGAAARAAGVEILAPAAALGFFDGIVAVWHRDTLHQIRAGQHVIASGTIEQPLVFAGNDLPGVMLAGGARRLAALWALAPGETAVVATTNDSGLESAAALLDFGVLVAAVADLRRGISGPAPERLRRAGIPLIEGATVVAAEGRDAVERAVIARVDAAGARVAGSELHVPCDLLAVSGGFAPATSLLSQAGAKTGYDAETGSFLASNALPDGVHAGGAVTGISGEEALERSGSLAGMEAAAALGLGSDESGSQVAELRLRLAELRAVGDESRAGAPQSSVPPPSISHGKAKCFICLCEDVTASEISHAVSEGFDSIELAKRYTTVTMGPCQGRMCQLPSIRLMARETGARVADVGATTARPPWSTVPLGVLAGRPFEPAKRSSLHARHHEAGANVMWAGDWRRPYDYGDVEEEVLAVHERAGLIDVSPLGKLLVRGPEAGDFLDRLYPNRVSTLAPGRIRYGVISSEAGRIMDDGTICRLDEDSFFVTTTSSGAEAVAEWFSWWLAAWRMEVELTDVTQGLAGINVAGPRARAVLESLTATDCSPEAFGYLDARQAHVAGVACLILRIGFVGELGYEIHFPAALGEYMWDALLQAGGPFGIRPFGLEAQRVLRLEKLHVIVGQDTDAESDPYGAGMPWIVKLDKEDFIGRWALAELADRPVSSALVGFSMADGALPREGAAVVIEGRPVGKVTSARVSRRVGHAIGMAWVPMSLAEEGTTITISDAGRILHGTVATRPFHDPEGARLRS